MSEEAPGREAVDATIEAHLRTLSALAVELAVTAPDVRRVNSQYGYVPWSLIERTRETCEAIGLDWRTLRQQAIVQASLGALVAEEQEEPS
jgi:hypothetical protein